MHLKSSTLATLVTLAVYAVPSSMLLRREEGQVGVSDGESGDLPQNASVDELMDVETEEPREDTEPDTEFNEIIETETEGDGKAPGTEPEIKDNVQEPPADCEVADTFDAAKILVDEVIEGAIRPAMCELRVSQLCNLDFQRRFNETGYCNDCETGNPGSSVKLRESMREAARQGNATECEERKQYFLDTCPFEYYRGGHRFYRCEGQSGPAGGTAPAPGVEIVADGDFCHKENRKCGDNSFCWQGITCEALGSFGPSRECTADEQCQTGICDGPPEERRCKNEDGGWCWRDYLHCKTGSFCDKSSGESASYVCSPLHSKELAESCSADEQCKTGICQIANRDRENPNSWPAISGKVCKIENGDKCSDDALCRYGSICDKSAADPDSFVCTP